MEIRTLNKVMLVVATIFVLEGFSYGQKSTGPTVWLNGGVGSCLVDAYDNGAAPMSMLGFGTSLPSGVAVEWGRYRWYRESRYTFGLLAWPYEGYVIGMNEGTGFLYRVCDSKNNRFHLWLGGSLHGEGSMKIIPLLKTCAVSSSVFGDISAEGMIRYDFAFVHDGSRNLLTAYAKLRLPLVGVVNYPGFSYMDNFVSDINLVSTLLSTYETRGIFFPGASTDIGLRFNLPNGNKIGLSYRWDYLTTRNRGYYRFDNAFHSVVVDFIFKLNR
jgi:hypothetical protein